jgi:hypothetical protein
VFVGEASALSALRGKCEPKRRDLSEEIETCGRHRAGCCLLWPRPCTCFGYSGTGHCAERVQSPLGTTGPSPSTLPPQILELWNEVFPVPFFPQIEVEILSLALGPCAGASWCCPTMGGWRRSCRGLDKNYVCPSFLVWLVVPRWADGEDRALLSHDGALLS